MQLTLEQLKVKLMQGIGVLQLLATLTPTTFDDEAVEFLRYLTQDTEALDRAWKLFQSSKTAAVEPGGG